MVTRGLHGHVRWAGPAGANGLVFSRRNPSLNIQFDPRELVMTGCPVLDKGMYDKNGVTLADISRASWRKSTFSNLNGNCVEVGFVRPDRIGVRDTKDNGTGPVLVFAGAEWSAFLVGAKAGEFDIS